MQVTSLQQAAKKKISFTLLPTGSLVPGYGGEQGAPTSIRKAPTLQEEQGTRWQAAHP